MLHRAPSVQHFWAENKNLFEAAWQEWEDSNKETLPTLGESLLDPKMRDAVASAWADPTTENGVRDLWEEVADGVFKIQFFDPQRLADLRTYLKEAAEAQIPLRPPYGIVLNSGGSMLDPRSEGYLAGPQFQQFYRMIMDHYMRPIGRLLFPEIMGYDGQTFGFSIHYQATTTDTSLRLHTDASAVTLNVNLNLPDEDYTGSAVHFYDAYTGRVTEEIFTPGTALFHRGNVAHAAQPITSGERSNFVFWLYGDHGQIPSYNKTMPTATPQQRWAVPTTQPDHFAPF